MSDQTITVKCAECGLDLPSDQSGSQCRAPCPRCGSSKQHIELNIAENLPIEIHDSVRGRLKDPSLPAKKNPRIDFFQGDDLRKADGRWMEKERVIDRDKNLYREVVVDPKTGEVVHRNEEPLSDHFGHGSDKVKKNAT